MPLDDEDENELQEELAMEWRRKGYVRSLGLWVEDLTDIDRYQYDNPFQFAIRPFNVRTVDAAPMLATCKKVGFEVLATSPFFRGWELERLIAEASARGYGDPKVLSSVLADLMLRFSLFQPDVDRVIIGMRKVEWVLRNVGERLQRAAHCRGDHLVTEAVQWKFYVEIPSARPPLAFISTLKHFLNGRALGVERGQL